MTVKLSISLTDQQAEFAKKLVAEGRYASTSAVIQQVLEEKRRENEAFEEEKQAFLKMIDERLAGPFVPLDEFRVMVDEMLEEESKKLGLDG